MARAAGLVVVKNVRVSVWAGRAWIWAGVVVALLAAAGTVVCHSKFGRGTGSDERAIVVMERRRII